MAAARQHQVQELVDAYLRQTGDLEGFLQQVPPDLRDEVQAQCREATFAAEFFRELPPLRLVQPLPHTIGGCELGELLGEGAMGRVLRGRQRELGRDVAVKLIRAEHQDHAEFLTRFREEARLLASLDHPGIVSVHACGEEAGWVFYVMDLVAGQSLLQALPSLLAQENNPGNAHRFDRAARIAAEVLETLAYAHGQGIVHRDLKPSNLMLDTAGRPRIVDFGLAKNALGPLRTAPGQLLGTPAYMSPELVARRECPPTAADLWAVGVILFQMLTGRLPYDGRDTDELLRQLLRPKACDPRAQLPDVPAPLAAICAKALSPALEDRYPSAAAFAADLRRFLAGEPVEAGQRTLVTSLWRVVRRHRRALAAVLLLAVGVSAAMRWAQERAEVDAAVRRIEHLAALDIAKEPAAVMASALVVADELLRGNLLDDNARRRGEELVARIRAHAKERHESGTGLVVAGAGTPAGTPFAEHKPPVPALQSQGLRELVEATVLDPQLPAPITVLNEVQPQLQIAAPVGTASAPVRIDALDPVTGQPILTVATTTAPCTVPVPHGHYRIVVGDANAFAECTRTVVAPGTCPVTISLSPTGMATNGMLLIKAGSSVIGQAGDGAIVYGQTTVQHPAFYIDRCEVTCGEYHDYCRQTGAPLPRTWDGAYDPAWANLPVWGVRQEHAKAYAEFRGKRLPTWTEWQIAARGPTGHPFPWGIEEAPIHDPQRMPHLAVSRSVAWHQALRAVGTTEQDRSWCGAVDMLGNVDEWTDTPYVAHLDGVPFPFYPWRVLGGRDVWTKRDRNYLALDGVAPGPTEHDESGFRCAKSAAP
ncbi:MAG: bifunctional serine/threonine-protein kinase/formylglycine-generating enzyme family protein [Planctomycetota bacterium]|jgi:formylglycine-generating enzyme required for sulfatase activity